MRARPTLVTLALVGWVLVWLIFAYRNWIQTGYTDFDVYYRTSLRLLQGDLAQIYSLAQDGNSPFRYAPWTLPLFAPWALLDPTASRLVWYVVQMSAFTLAFYAFAKRMGALQSIAAPVTLLLVLRFVIDHALINQVTGLMALGLALAFSGITQDRALKLASGVFVPFSLKIGSLLTAFQLGPKALLRVSFWIILFVALFSILTALLFGGSHFLIWVQEWWILLRADSGFFDSSHYGSQSLNSLFQRLAIALDFDKNLGLIAHRVVSIPLLALTIWTWWKKPAQSIQSKGLHFGLGVMAYLVLMPFTFKYSMPLLFFALLPWLLAPLTRIDRILLTWIVLTMSLPGLDVVGRTAFFAIQKASLPAIGMLALYIRLLYLSRRIT